MCHICLKSIEYATNTVLGLAFTVVLCDSYSHFIAQNNLYCFMNTYSEVLGSQISDSLDFSSSCYLTVTRWLLRLQNLFPCSWQQERVNFHLTPSFLLSHQLSPPLNIRVYPGSLLGYLIFLSYTYTPCMISSPGFYDQPQHVDN